MSSMCDMSTYQYDIQHVNKLNNLNDKTQARVQCAVKHY